jgi:MFS family permease
MAQTPSPTVLAGSAEPAGRRVGAGAGDVVYLSALSAMAILGANIVLPAFPALQAAFGLEDAEVRMVLTAYLLAWAAGQLLLGAALDRHSP